ncbi:hypothetical protein Tco_0532079 [Tanacetum coccineum]
MTDESTCEGMCSAKKLLYRLKRLGLALNKDKSQLAAENLDFGEDDDGVEDKGCGSVTINSWGSLISEDMRLECVL